MEIRTTNPELEELISILAENNVTEALQRFAYQWHQILPEDPNDDIPLFQLSRIPSIVSITLKQNLSPIHQGIK